MDNLKGNLKIAFVLLYLDDITVFSRTLTDHLSPLRSVFDRLWDAILKLKLSKCFSF